MADTIKMGSTLIEEGAPLPAPVSFESEAWISFYRAGETIRRLRTVLKNEASTETESPEAPEDHRLDDEASSRMDDRGCRNERAASLLDVTG